MPQTPERNFGRRFLQPIGRISHSINAAGFADDKPSSIGEHRFLTDGSGIVKRGRDVVSDGGPGNDAISPL